MLVSLLALALPGCLSGGQEAVYKVNKKGEIVETAKQSDDLLEIMVNDENLDPFDVYNNGSPTGPRTGGSYGKPRKKKDTKTLVREFEAMQPSLERLVAIESDLKYLVKELSKLVGPAQAPDDGIPTIDGDPWEEAQAATEGETIELIPMSTPPSKKRGDEVGSFGASGPKVIPETSEAMLETALPTIVSFGAEKQQDETRPEPIASGTVPSEEQDMKKLAVVESMSSAAQVEGAVIPVIDSNIPTASIKPPSVPSFGPITTPPTPPVIEAQPFVEVAADSLSDFFGGEGYLVHVASYTNPQDAEQGWTQLLDFHGDLFQEVQKIIEIVDLGPSSGLFYQLKAGPLASENAALGLCDVLQTRGFYCQVAAVTRP